jgi:hypothetical protein
MERSASECRMTTLVRSATGVPSILRGRSGRDPDEEIDQQKE